MNGNGRFLIAAGPLALLWALSTGAGLAWRLVFLWCALGLVLYLQVRYWVASLSCSVELRNQGSAHGGAFEITYIFANNGLIPIPECLVSVHLEKELGAYTLPSEPMAFAAGELRRFSRSVRCPRRGVYEVGGTTAVFRDMLGLFRYPVHFNRRIRLEVYPHIYPMGPLVASGKEEGGALRGPSAVQQDYTGLNRLRQALPQEPARHIHWKASARTEELQVLEYEAPRRPGVILILDSSADKYLFDLAGNHDERCVEVVAGLAAFWLSKDIPVDLRIGPGEGLGLKGPEAMMLALRTLMVYKPSGQSRLLEALTRFAGSCPAGAALQVVTPRLSLQEAHALLALPGVTVTVFCTQPADQALPERLRVVQVPLISWEEHHEAQSFH